MNERPDPEMELQDTLAAQFIAQPSELAGVEMRPHTLGTELLMSQILKRFEPPISAHLYACAFLYVHAADKKEVLKSVASGDIEKMMDFASKFDAADMDKLFELISANSKQISASRVDVKSEGQAAPVGK